MNKRFEIPEAAWSRRFDQELEEPGRPSRLITPRRLFQLLPTILRMRSRLKRLRQLDRVPLIDILKPAQPGPVMGVPLGGLGAGTITHGWRGGFRRWQFRPGIYHYGLVPADQFSIFVQPQGLEPQTQTLAPDFPENGSLAAWKWGMDPTCATYHALYPRAWTQYEEPIPGIRLVCKQLSPVIPHNYQESSYPVGVFHWQVENLTDLPMRVGLMFTFQNGIGTENDFAGGHYNRWFESDQTQDPSISGKITGVTLHHTHRQFRGRERTSLSSRREVFEDQLTFAIAGLATQDNHVTYRTRFRTDRDGLQLWEDFSSDGMLINIDAPDPSARGETIGAALAQTVSIPPRGMREVVFVLAWDMPIVRTGLGTAYYRRYTQFFGSQGDIAPDIAIDALSHHLEWDDAIQAWQKPILEDPDLPTWYKTALLNELYYLADGGTMWVYGIDEDYPQRDDLGRFAYLEGHEYRMYNTYDVHFYASYALGMLWPELELTLQRDIAHQIRRDYIEEHTLIDSGTSAPRKIRGVVPHDIGAPGEDPWLKINAYNFHDSSRWKDLTPKFVLQVYRDFLATGDTYFIATVWDAIELAIKYTIQFDRDGDGLIENEGIPDQTYDVWSVEGPSAYTGGLWLACLLAAAEISDRLGEEKRSRVYQAIFKRGRAAYQRLLWNGRYYNYDSSSSPYHNSIMADQLAGYWYARACGLAPIVDPIHARSSLQTVFEFNVQRFRNGEMGAVNGMLPDGRIDRTSIQSQEVWTGTTYALAAAMLQEGLVDEAFATAWGIYNVTYQQRGYWFQTPEAWDENGNYRSLGYMRPLAIWAMQWAWERNKTRISNALESIEAE